MPRKETRAWASRKVAYAADALNDKLLVREQEAKDAIERVFLDQLKEVGRLTTAMHERKSTKDLETLFTLAAGTCGLVIPLVDALIVDAAGMALDAIGVELGAIEKNLGMKFDGLGAQSVERASDIVGWRADELLNLWADDVAAALIWFEEQVDAAWRTVWLKEESLEDALRRMISTTPVRLPGQGGVGLWWKPFQSVFAATKAQEFVMVNEVRQQAMFEFNKAGMVIRDGS